MGFPNQIGSSFLETLCKAYDLGSPCDSIPMPGTRNRNLVVRTDRGEWFVRNRYGGYSEPGRISFDHEAVKFLSARGVPVVLPLSNTDGASFTTYDGAIWEIYPFVEGTPFLEGDAGLFKALGAAVAGFHEAGRGFPLRCNKLAPRGETDPAVIFQQIETIERGNPACASVLHWYRTWTSDATKVLPDAAFRRLPHTLVHGDLQTANIIVNGDRIAAFVDLDWCAWQPRIYDLAFAVLFCCSTHKTPIRGDDIWSLTQPPILTHESVEAFLQSYQAHTSPFSHHEMRALRSQAILSWCHSRVAGALKVPPQDRSAFLSRPPDSLHSMLSAWSKSRGGTVPNSCTRTRNRARP